jgi:hypothetical protein
MNWKKAVGAGVAGLVAVAGLGTVVFDEIWASQHEGSRWTLEIGSGRLMMGMETRNFQGEDKDYVRELCRMRGIMIAEPGIYIQTGETKPADYEQLESWHGSCIDVSTLLDLGARK